MKVETQGFDSIQDEINLLLSEGDINLNLGCGELHIPNAVNCDLYNPSADKKLNALDLSEYADGSVNTIYAMQLLEHFTFDEATNALKEWERALRKGGHLILGVPDMGEAIKAISQWGDNIVPELWKGAMMLVYGCQNGSGQVHKWGYSPQYLSDTLKRSGFTIKKVYQGYPRRPTPTVMVIANKGYNGTNLGKWEPISEYAMSRKSPPFTICETLRMIYSRSDDPDVKYLCRIATTMAKHMVDKLIQYNQNFNEEAWTDKTEDVIKQLNEQH